ncbi:MAG: zinc ribbon domain-containing protein [Dehalococcoidia bacterium]
MPLYEYHCRTCGETFEVRRPMSQVAVEEVCPEGHAGAKRVLSTFATVGVAQEGGIAPSAFQGASACCNPGACGCH